MKNSDRNKLRVKIDFNKNTKLKYYLVNFSKLLIPSIYFRTKLNSTLKNIPDIDYIQDRVNYYNKLENNFDLPADAISIKNFYKIKRKTYKYDLLEYLRYFNEKFKVSYLFGDNTIIPEIPSFVKSRPIDGDNQNTVLMKLNHIRHFIYVNDTIKFEDKKNMLVWRGKAYQPHRQEFLKKFYDHPLCDVGQIVKSHESQDISWAKKTMSLKKHLQYKFVLTIEGNDVASNLKWVMSSNSLAFMVKPTYETWFMEGRLIPNHHYVLLKDDYSDLEEKIDYYSTHIEESLAIIKNANEYTKQFQNKKNEDIISLLVLKKYFEKSNQL